MGFILFSIWGSMQISTINFAQIPQSPTDGGHLPNGYGGFNWENAYYIFQCQTSGTHHWNGFRNAFTNSRNCVAYNSKGSAMSIFLSNARTTFDLHSFEAISIYHENFKLSITAYRSNLIYDTKKLILTKKAPRLFETDWYEIDGITFTPERNYETSKPETFALTCLNLLLWNWIR